MLSIFDSSSLDTDGEPTPVYINISDSTFKSIALLPSPNGDLSNVIVLSTTMKNRYLIQLATPALLTEWTAAFRLALFEQTSLQEAYTGALLSSKGAKLNGIKTLLTETKFRLENYVSVRFGSGMPWKKCWAVISPKPVKKKKHLPPPCTIAFYEDKKNTKKAPLALVTGAYASYAVYPQSSVLVNQSTMIKIEGKVAFNDVQGEKDASIFIMPDPHPGVPGFETLIRFLIPVLDTFFLYGRPARLNSDKADMRSLLFGMPSLPFTQYLETHDVKMLANVNGSENWTPYEWTRNIKDLLARKMSTGYKGTGKLKRRPNSMRPASMQPRGRDRSVSQPMPADLRASMLPAASSNLGSVYEQQSERPPHQLQQQQNSYPEETNGTGIAPQRQAPAAPTGPIVISKQRTYHERSASQGHNPNNLLSAPVAPGHGPISPIVAQQAQFDAQSNHSSTYDDNSNHLNSSSSNVNNPRNSYTPSTHSRHSAVHRTPVGAHTDTEPIPASLDASQPAPAPAVNPYQTQPQTAAAAYNDMFDPTANTPSYNPYRNSRDQY